MAALIPKRKSRSRKAEPIGLCWVVFLLSLPSSTWSIETTLNDDRAVANEWYTRYEEYPPYCSTPEEVSRRRIPDLQVDKRTGETRLQHVTAVFRHGARTPWSPSINCWEGYATNPETAVWDCDLTTYISPPTPKRVSKEGDTDAGSDEAMFLFEKQYDALLSPQINLSNYFQGTCQMGQLILRGYEQTTANGKFLREAYIFDKSKFNHNERMRLLNIDSHREGNVWDEVYYRVDDEQRTLMSGQLVLRGALGPEMDAYFKAHHVYPVIPLHTADYSRDIVGPNERVCPRLTEIRQENYKSSTFQAYNRSTESDLLRSFQSNVLKLPTDTEMDAIDCLMTTMCTDRPLPDAVNDYGMNRRLQDENSTTIDYGSNLFQRLYERQVQKTTINYKLDDSRYSKLAMGPLWHEIMENINPILQGDDPRFKLAMFSGHDTTLMPLLAALDPKLWDDKDWPSYASMIVLEIHEVNIDGFADKSIFRTDYAFRLLYNGRVLTTLVDGCPSDLDLCDLEILVNRVRTFATLERDCARQHEEATEWRGAVGRTKDLLSTTEGVVYFVILVGTGAAAGAVATFFYLTGTLPHWKAKHRGVPHVDADDGIALTGGERFRSSNGLGGQNGYSDDTMDMNGTLT